MKGEIYRYYIKKQEQYEEYINENKIFLVSHRQANNYEELKKYFIEEQGYGKRAISSIVNGYGRMVPGDFLWMKYEDRFALGKVKSSAQFENSKLWLEVNFYEVEKTKIPSHVINAFKGMELQRILKDQLYEQTEAMYHKLEEKTSSKEENFEKEQQMEIFDGGTFEIEFTKEKGELIEISPPMVKAKNELSPLPKKDDIQLTYQKKKKDPSFELVIEMHAPKDLRLDHKKSSVPAVIAPKEKSIPKTMDIYEKILTDQMTFFLQWQKMNFDMYLKMQQMFYGSYLQMLEFFK